MKKIILFISILLAVSASTTFAQAAKDTMQMKMEAKKYTCPMHPEVVKSKPGKCPKCGMALVEKKMVMPKYTCTMHPEIVKGKAGKCPKCGMEMVPMKMKNKRNT
jgi:membrane protease subunit (stomatin/prohibitin family)